MLFQHSHEIQNLLGSVQHVQVAPKSPNSRSVAVDDEDDELELDRISPPPASVSDLKFQIYFFIKHDYYFLQLDLQTTKCAGPVKDQGQVSYINWIII